MFDIKSIANDLVFPVCSPEFLAGLPADVSISDVATLPLLHMDAGDKDWPDWHNFLSAFMVEPARPEPRLVFSSYQVCLEVAEHGGGVVLGWARSVSREIAEGKLVRLTEAVLDQPDGICVHIKKSWQQDSTTESVVDIIRDSLTQLVP